MRRLKWSIWLKKKRTIFFFSTILMLLLVLGWGLPEIRESLNDPVFVGVAGTLLGALTGGFLSLLGSVWVNSKQQRSVQNLRKKNIIYRPLYDELVEISDMILLKNPYPTLIAFEKSQQTMMLHPQYDAWRRIKLDSRYLDVPPILVKQMEKLEKAIIDYKNVRKKASKEIQDSITGVLKENGLEGHVFLNLGSVISRSILASDMKDLYSIISTNNNDCMEAQSIEEFNRVIYDYYDDNKIIVETRKSYDYWISVQRDTIEMLALLIKQASIK